MSTVGSIEARDVVHLLGLSFENGHKADPIRVSGQSFAPLPGFDMLQYHNKEAACSDYLTYFEVSTPCLPHQAFPNVHTQHVLPLSTCMDRLD